MQEFSEIALLVYPDLASLNPEPHLESLQEEVELRPFCEQATDLVAKHERGILIYLSSLPLDLGGIPSKISRRENSRRSNWQNALQNRFFVFGFNPDAPFETHLEILPALLMARGLDYDPAISSIYAYGEPHYPRPGLPYPNFIYQHMYKLAVVLGISKNQAQLILELSL